MAAPSPTVVVAALLDPTDWWGGSTVTYSTATLGSVWTGYSSSGEPFSSGYQVLNTLQSARVGVAAEAWDALIRLNLNQTNDLIQPGQIRVGFSNVDDNSDEDIWGYAMMPPGSGGTGSSRAGDIWIDAAKSATAFTDGSYDYTALIHEFGHALGLKHPFEDGATLPGDYDTRRYTVMSYTNYTDDVYRTAEATATGVRTVVKAIYATTPMVYDVAAIQARYGADTATAAGDTTYTWSQSQPMMQTVYDAGGVDLIDLSTHTRSSIIDLTPGAYSSIDYFSAQAQAAYWTSLYPWAASFMSQQFEQASTYTWSNNLGIAFSTVIENVQAGSGADTVTGNAAANNLNGGAGDDSLEGADGDDYLRGADGNDRIVGGSGFDDINGNMGDDTANGGLGSDWVVGGKDRDLLFGDDGDDIVYGNMGNDTLNGGAGDDIMRGGQDDDTLSGGAGDDWLSGDRGADTLSGGAGADVFHAGPGTGLDRILDFSRAEGDRVQLDPGTAYTLSQQGADVDIDLGQGDHVLLVGVTLSSLGSGWIFGA
ncbi:MAG: M10 family metallopeptidase [Phenylobacterium sp.]|uniref:M10 family metallopeptidase n=1 Tax=Phenylobacterium sp. TaxID=1871053 RepID=UPI0027356699|nr:M10 family metallopeptidase [Phenylobacterium sp.]MDP3174523.1 M10 family metallopeptidase [Phenylobacterium sp.]